MKKLVFLLLVVFTSQYVIANHTKGGYMYYEYLGQGSNSNKVRYRITLKLYTACSLNSGQFDPSINFTFFNASTFALVSTDAVGYRDSVNIQNCTQQACHQCINPIPSICYKITTYELVKELDKIGPGYIVSYQRCCRIAGINNIQTSNNVGDTWTVTIPGTATAPNAEKNSSARFTLNDTAIICENSYFTFDFKATDINGDSLAYRFSDAYDGGSTGNPTPNPAGTPPYNTVPYAGGFFGNFPMGGGVTINPKTGVVSGTAPTAGVYVLTVTVSEFLPGTTTKIAEVRKSLHIQVANCTITNAQLQPEYVTCDGFTMNFSNEGSNANVQTWFWDFGVAGQTNDTSNLPTPSFTYPDTGVYKVKFVLNRGLACSDSTTTLVKVYPGFFPGFTVAGQCKNLPIYFTDTTKTNYGTVSPWSWDFGMPLLLDDTSHLQNPSYIYPAAGNYTVTFVVGNTKGCIDTVTKDIVVVDKADLTLSNDTLICFIDTLQLFAYGNGTVLWTPNYNINDVTDHFPLVSPDVPTTYYVTLSDPFGCKTTDSVRVNVKQFVTLDAGPDTTICQSDPLVLNPNSDGLYYTWSPPGSLSDPHIKNPTALPTGTTTYSVVSSIGKCTAQDQVTIKVVPYPNAKANNDTAVCFGSNVQLSASGGYSYAWLPTAFLTNNHIPNPVSVAPTASIAYVVYVRDTLGCPKPATDTVFVTVYQPIKANAGPRDTSVVLDEPLQLLATGSTNYLWTPSLWLNNPNIPNPIALPRNNIDYVVKVSNAAGCFGLDTIRVKVYFVDPSFYVPTAFTPNGDGRNDVFMPIALGIKSLDKFMVYNRWGQLMFSTTSIGQGWDGTFGGRPQDSATFVWVAEGTDYKNRKIKKKGTVILIR